LLAWLPYSWSCLYGSRVSVEDRKRSTKWPSLQLANSFDIRVDTFWRSRRFRGASEWFGEAGVILAAALAGLIDTHSAAISVASLVASEKMSATDAVFPILVGLSTNTASKMIIAGISGGRSFALRVIPGLIVVVLAAWAGATNILS
jgi:uncharacterized membrane protein (DUF4010 family)